MKPYQCTEADIKLYFHLKKSFGNFLVYLGMEPNTLLAKALSTDDIQLVYATEEDRPTVIAWAAWQFYTKFQRTILWEGRTHAVSENAMDILVNLPLPEMLKSSHYQQTKRSLINVNESRVLATNMSEHAARGMTVTCVVLDQPVDSNKWQEIYAITAPCFRSYRWGKLITITRKDFC